MTTGHDAPTREQVLQWLNERRNWGRWGTDDQRGAINLITAEKRIAAARLVQTGRSVSLSREFPKTPSPVNPNPAQHFMSWRETEDGGVATDTPDRPVHGWELEAIAKQNGVTMEPGDAIAVYCGREAYVASDPGGTTRPGLHASCLEFIRDHDVAVLVWDMLDAVPNDYGLYRTVHYAIWAFGVALVDNALLQPLAEACAEENRATFMLTIAPLRVAGGTGSPVNPIALF